MARNPASRRAEARTAFAALALVFGAGCRRPFETASKLPDEPRRTDGVVVVPTPARPAPRARADVSAVVAVEDGDVERVVRAYVLAMLREDEAALEELLSDAARPLQRSGGRQQVLDAWKGKLKGEAGSRALVVPSPRLREMVVGDAASVPLVSARPDGLGATDLFVRVPITRAPGDTRFGDVLVLVLRAERGALRIVTQADES